jgi:hypothetical protein
MPITEEIARKAQSQCDDTGLSVETELKVARIAVNLALEWAARQCEVHPEPLSVSQDEVASRIAWRIRAGKSG